MALLVKKAWRKRGGPLAGQTDIGRPPADPQEVGMPDVVAFAVGHYESERLERLLPEALAEFFGCHAI